MKLETTLPERVGFLHAVPIFDLFALLLIAIMLGPSFITQAGVQVEMPVSRFQVARQSDASVITITQGEPPVIWLERMQVSEEELVAKLESRRQASIQVPVVYVRSDKQISAEFERRVTELALQAGFRVYLLGRAEESR
ncbi:ExbD/TolR family protein [Haloferula rosea]|uniref:Biopolymer transporter ExbD n=1 Tax=Haloferula rosea TaxID=490093 RepID=A0A934VBN7_9BACT|nr:biopolymer transporter ExbD [Haloferula rosea]MBK1827583.1 biopolymer transporter ExbD [Haloferula rosea]